MPRKIDHEIWVRSHSRSFKPVPLERAVSYSPSIVTILHPFWDTEQIMVENRDFFIPLLHSTPRLKGFPWECCHPVRCGKSRMVGLQDGEKNFQDTYNRLNTIPVCDRRTSCDGIVHAMHTFLDILQSNIKLLDDNIPIVAICCLWSCRWTAIRQASALMNSDTMCLLQFASARKFIRTIQRKRKTVSNSYDNPWKQYQWYCVVPRNRTENSIARVKSWPLL